MFKITNIKPLFTGIVCTANKYETDQTSGGVIVDANKMEGYLKEYQTVLAVGSSVRDIQVGDIILINPKNYLIKDKLSSENSIRNEFMQPTYHLEIPQAELNGESVLTIDQRDVSYVIEGEEVPDEVKSDLILPKVPKIVL